MADLSNGGDALRVTDLEKWMAKDMMVDHESAQVWVATPEGILKVTAARVDSQGDLLFAARAVHGTE